jgi:nicotinate-nucleotide adenylyltransferase
MRVALFGGTFDPIHRGHLAIATAAADACALDRVLFAPVGHQPLKPRGSYASYADRIAMTQLACQPGPLNPVPDARFFVSVVDAPRTNGEPNYTVDTLATLARQFPAASLFVIAGADSFLDLRRWRQPERLFDLAEWIVVSRPDFPLGEQDLAQLALTPAHRARVHLLTTVHEDISATELRERLHAGDPCSGLLPPAVADYIQAHHLYH